MNTLICLLATLSFGSEQPSTGSLGTSRAPAFEARNAIADELVIHRAHQGITRANGIVYRAVTREDLERDSTKKSQATGEPDRGSENADSVPIREVRTVVRLDGPFMLWLDPKRNQGLEIGNVRRAAVGAPTTNPLRPLSLGSTVVPANAPLRTVTTSVDVSGLRVQPAPRPLTTDRTTDRKPPKSMRNSLPKSPTTVR